MPLSSEQKQFIEDCVGHLLDFPPDAKDITNEIAHIKKAFNGDELKPDDQLVFIQKPCEYLLRLEHIGPAPTIGEVQKHVLMMANQRIEAFAQKNHFEIKKNDWDEKELTKKIEESKTFNTPFQTVKPKLRSDDCLYPIPSHPDQVFKAKVEVSEDLTKIIMKLQIVFPDNTKSNASYEVGNIPEFKIADPQEQALEQDRFLLGSAYINAPFAEYQTMIAVLEYLLSEKIISNQEISELNNPCSLLLTYKTYLELFIKQIINTSEISTLTEEEVRVLTQEAALKLIRDQKTTIHKLRNLTQEQIEALNEPAILKLLEDNKCEPDEIFKLSPIQQAIITNPYYKRFVYEGTLPIREISKFSSNECKNLALPIAIHLLKLNKVKLNQARFMSEGTQLVISDDFYSKLLIDNKLEYSQIENLDLPTAKLLISSKIIQLIANNTLTVAEAKKLKASERIILETDSIIFYLVSNNLLLLSQINLIMKENELDPKLLVDNYKVTPLKKEELQKVKPYITDFMQLTVDGLMYNTDLRYLIDNFSKLNLLSSDQKEEKQKDEKALPKAIKLLQLDSMLKRCKTNIINKIQTIGRNIETKEKSISNLKNICEKYKINFNKLQINEFEKMVYKYYMGPDKFSLADVILGGQRIGLTLSEITSHVLGSRIYAIYMQEAIKIGKQIDSIESIKSDIEVVAQLINSSVVNIENNIILFLMEKIKNTLATFKIANSNELSNKFDNEINFIKQLLSVTKDDNHKKRSIFNAYNYMHTLTMLACFDLKISYVHFEPKVKKPLHSSMSLFLPKEEKQDPKEKFIYFVKNIESMGDFFGIKKLTVVAPCNL